MLVSELFDLVKLVKRTGEFGDDGIYWINDIESNIVYPLLTSIDPQRFLKDQSFKLSAGGGYDLNSDFDNIRALYSGVYCLDVVSGSITAFADAGGGQITVTSADHGLANSDVVRITGTTNYDGEYTISGVTTDTFEITDTFVATDTGVWTKGTHEILYSLKETQKGSKEVGYWIDKASDKIYFTPESLTGTYTVRYIPELTEITTTSQSLILPNRFKKQYVELLYSYYLSDAEDGADQGKIVFIEQASKIMEDRIVKEYKPTVPILNLQMYSDSDNFSRSNPWSL